MMFLTCCFLSFDMMFRAILGLQLTAMSYEQKQIFRLNKQLVLKQQQLKRQRAMLQQKVELLTAEIAEYQEKQLKSKQLNESIMLTYRQNQSFREQLNQREQENLLQQHHGQLNALKHRYGEDKKQLEEQLHSLKSQNQRLRIEADKNQLQHEKNLAEVRRELEERQGDSQNDLNAIFSHQMALLTERLKQAEEMAQLYKAQLQSHINCSYRNPSECQQHEQPGQSSIEQNQRQALLRKGKGGKGRQAKPSAELSSLQLRINQALVQLNPTHAQLQHKIRQIKFKIY